MRCVTICAIALAATAVFAQSPGTHEHSFGGAQPGGRVAIIDFRLDSSDGPPAEARIAPERVRAEMKQAGYVLVGEHEFLPRQYFLIFRGAYM